MPIHHRIPSIIGQAIYRGVGYIRAEQKFFQGLYGPKGRYPGVSNYKQAATGVRHGLAAGGAASSFISDTVPIPGNGTVPFNGSKANPPNKARYRRGRYSRRQSKRCRPTRSRFRHSYSRKSY